MANIWKNPNLAEFNGVVGGSGVNCQLQAIGPKLIFPQLIWVDVVVPKEQGPQLKTTQKSAMGAAEVQSLSQRKVKVEFWRWVVRWSKGSCFKSTKVNPWHSRQFCDASWRDASWQNPLKKIIIFKRCCRFPVSRHFWIEKVCRNRKNKQNLQGILSFDCF